MNPIRLLTTMQMWKFFSHYGMRALLILYMVDSLAFSDASAFRINAIFCALTEVGGILGGYFADRYLGLRRAFLLGSILLATGYVAILFQGLFFLSLMLIILGSSFFFNIAALIGSASGENARSKSYTQLYMLQNFGAFVSTLICAAVAKAVNYQLGFAIAALGMLIGNVQLFFRWRSLKEVQRGEKSTRKIDLKRQKKLWAYLLTSVLFYAASDQICSSLILFSERAVDRTLFGWQIPSSWIMSLNPIIIVSFGTLVAKKRFGLLVPFLLLGGSYGMLALLCLLHVPISIMLVMGMVTLLSIAELMVGPVIYTEVSKVAAKGSPGVIMGMIPVSFALSSLLGGSLGKMVTSNYGLGFGKMALLLISGGIFIKIVLFKITERDKITSV